MDSEGGKSNRRGHARGLRRKSNSGFVHKRKVMQRKRDLVMKPGENNLAIRPINNLATQPRVNNVKQQANKPPGSEYILNLTKEVLSKKEIMILDKGLKFVPTGKPPSRGEILRDFERFCRSLRLKHLYGTIPVEGGESTRVMHPMKLKSGFCPQETDNEALETYIARTRQDFEQAQLWERFNPNVSREELRAIKNLGKKAGISIAKADKNRTVVLQTEGDYRKEILSQLNDGVHYVRIEKSGLERIDRELRSMVMEMKYCRNSFDDSTYLFLMNPDMEIWDNKMFTLPKIHKVENIFEINVEQGVNVPGRPILSQTGCPTRGVAQLLAHILRPIVQKQETYVKDSVQAVSRLSSVDINEIDFILGYDIKSMYSCIPIEEMILDAENALEAHPGIDYPFKRPKNREIIELLSFVLKNTEIEYEGMFWAQTRGAPMGGKASGDAADITVYKVINEIINNAEVQENIKLHIRFKDDGVIYFRGSRHKADTFFRIANEAHDSIKFKFTISETETDFLDIRIEKKAGRLYTKVYVKPTETYQFLHPGSSHGKAVFIGFIKSECKRFLRLTNNKKDFEERKNLFKGKLEARGYNKQIIRLCGRFRFENKQAILGKTAAKNRRRGIPLITKFHPSTKKTVNEIIGRHWHLIEEDQALGDKIGRPMVCYRKSPNCKDILEKAQR